MNCLFKSKRKRNFKISYGKETEDAIKQMTSIIQAHTEYPSKRLRFIAIQYLLDNPKSSENYLQSFPNKLNLLKRS